MNIFSWNKQLDSWKINMMSKPGENGQYQIMIYYDNIMIDIDILNIDQKMS